MKTIYPIELNDISNILGADFNVNQNFKIYGLNRIEYAQKGELTFLRDKKFTKYLDRLDNVVLIIDKDIDVNVKDNIIVLEVDDAYMSFVKIINYIYSLKEKERSFFHKTVVSKSNAQIDSTAFIGPGCVIGDNCKIGKNVVLKSNVVLYDNVIIDDNTYIHSSVVICDETKIGKNCIIHPGAIIGSDGFGFVEHKDGSYEKIPQIGNVIVSDDVEIGSNVTVDRALVGSTIIHKGVKIDNLCQIAHNVDLGENSAMAAQVGISGSTSIGKRNRLGGQVGISGHLQTVDDVILLAQSGVAKDVENKGIYFGSPIKDRLKAFKIEAALNQLPELIKLVQKIKKKIGLKD